MTVSVIAVLSACRARHCERGSAGPRSRDAGKKKVVSGVDRCRASDDTNVPLPPLPATFDPGVATERPEEHAMRDALDTACGDVWCESEFEYWFHRYRCEPSGDRCVLQMRMYRTNRESPELDAGPIEVTDPHFRGRIVSRAALASCAPPCFTDRRIYEPCQLFDVECEIAVPPSAGAHTYKQRGYQEAYDCTSETLRLVEKRLLRERRK